MTFFYFSAFQIVFVRPASELGSLAQQYGFSLNDVVAITDRLVRVHRQMQRMHALINRNLLMGVTEVQN